MLIEIRYLHTIGTWYLPEIFILSKLKCNRSQFYRLHLICQIWCFHWSCPMTCSVRFGNSVLSSTVVFQHASSWGCQVHFESWQSFLYISQVLLQAALRGSFLAPQVLPYSIEEEKHCIVEVRMVFCHYYTVRDKTCHAVLGHSRGSKEIQCLFLGVRVKTDKLVLFLWLVDCHIPFSWMVYLHVQVKNSDYS